MESEDLYMNIENTISLQMLFLLLLYYYHYYFLFIIIIIMPLIIFRASCTNLVLEKGSNNNQYVCQNSNMGTSFSQSFISQ